MLLKPNYIALLLTLTLSSLGVTDVYAKKKLYRWVDEQGNVFFSDQIPPDQVQHKRETLNEKAQVLDTLEKARTPEELARLKRLEELRKEQEKIIAKQAAAYKVLLATYRNLDDINRALENKLALLDGKKRVIDGNMKSLELQLRHQQEQAANHERNAQKVPEKLLKDIASTRQQIASTEQELAKHEQERQTTEREFRADIARFEFLTRDATDNQAVQRRLAASNANSEIGLFECPDAEQCQKAWRFAAEFVYKHATTERDVETDKLIMTAAPVYDNDFSLSASLLTQTDNSQLIFLDIRCKTSNIGQDLCNSEKAQTLRRDFSAYIQSQLSSQQ
ncbi:MAG: DUF4124 domain-containing protein [Methylomonas sp.]|nr:DUF4124 domain-containing protein [Methylomonas sp.]